MASQYLQAVPLPPALPTILEQLLKAILRDQPTDIIVYCAQYFETLSLQQQIKQKRQQINPQILKKVQTSAIEYFKTIPKTISKEEVIIFLRYFASNIPEQEPYPNSLECAMKKINQLTHTHQLPYELAIDTVAQFFSN